MTTSPRIVDRLESQGYVDVSLHEIERLYRFARLTPACCATTAILGIFLESPIYFFVLAAFTSIGAFTNSSVYDRLYNVLLRHVVRGDKIPNHGAPRRLGCGIGSAMLAGSGISYLAGSEITGMCLAGTLAVLAAIAAITHFCFASAIYCVAFGRPVRCCSEK